MTTLAPAARAVVERGLHVASEALDTLRPVLLAASGSVAVDAKSDGTPITAVDLEADDRLADALTGAFPAHGMLSEERATTSPDTEWTWIVDPIDGTSNFVCGLPYWCVSIALALDGAPVLGIVDAPALDRRYVAVLGAGAVSAGRRLAVRTPVDWRDPRQGHVPVMLTTGTARGARAAGLALNPRVMGSTALDLAVVADGVAAASIALRPKVWDVAAGWLLVEEAGGQVVTIEGAPLLPVRTGVEHTSLTAPTAAGPDAGMVIDLARALIGAV